MKEKLKRLLLGSLLSAFCIGIGAVSAQAAPTLKKLADKSCTQTAAFSADVTNDGKADKITVKPVGGEAYWADKFRITVNGTTAYTVPGGAYYEVWYIGQSRSRQFLQVICREPGGGYICENRVLRYDRGQKKFIKVLDLGTSSLGAGGAVTKVTSTRIQVKHAYAVHLTSALLWNYYYTYKGGKFVRISNNAQPTLYFNRFPKYDGYDSYFKKNQFVAKKKMNFYKSAGSSVRAFTASPGNVLKLTRIRLINGKTLWVQFQKGSTPGWIKYTGYDQINNFYGVANRVGDGSIL